MSQGKNKGCSKSLLIFFLLFGIYFWKISETQTFYKLLSQFSVFPNDCTIKVQGSYQNPAGFTGKTAVG